MNKQLAALAAKSGFDVGIHDGLILGNFSDMYKLDKFAELIIQECTTICEVEKVLYNKDRKEAYDFQDKNIYAEGAAAADTIKHKIKRQFGLDL